MSQSELVDGSSGGAKSWEDKIRNCDAAKYAPEAMERLIEQAKREQDDRAGNQG